MGDSLHQKFMPLIAERGSIYSEDGNILSTSVPIFDIYVDFAADGLREKDGKRFKDNIDSLSYLHGTTYLKIKQLLLIKRKCNWRIKIKTVIIH